MPERPEFAVHRNYWPSKRVGTVRARDIHHALQLARFLYGHDVAVNDRAWCQSHPDYVPKVDAWVAPKAGEP